MDPRSSDPSASDRSAVPVRSSAADAPAGSLFDFQTAVARLDHDEELFDDMVRFFCADAPGLLRQIREASQRGDAREVQRAAHSLKGLAATFDGKATMTAALDVEELGKAGRLANIDAAAGVLEREVARLTRALTDFRPHTRPGSLAT